MKILVTGATGFFGGLLKGRLERAGHSYVNLDRLVDPADEAAGKMAVCDLRDADAVEAVFAQRGPFDAVCHVAVELAHEAQDKQGLWKSNVDGTRNVAECCRRHGVKKLIYNSTNCLWGPSAQPAGGGERSAVPGRGLWQVEAGGGGDPEGLHVRPERGDFS
jgi:UDP-glucose 4-epimerase